jgi:hypothetical protein
LLVIQVLACAVGVTVLQRAECCIGASCILDTGMCFRRSTSMWEGDWMCSGARKILPNTDADALRCASRPRQP